MTKDEIKQKAQEHELNIALMAILSDFITASIKPDQAVREIKQAVVFHSGAVGGLKVHAANFASWANSQGIWFDDEYLLWNIPDTNTEEWRAEHPEFPTDEFRFTSDELYDLWPERNQYPESLPAMQRKYQEGYSDGFREGSNYPGPTVAFLGKITNLIDRYTKEVGETKCGNHIKNEISEFLNMPSGPLPAEGDAVEFAEWLDDQRDGKKPIWQDTSIWGREGAFKKVYSLFKGRPLTEKREREAITHFVNPLITNDELCDTIQNTCQLLNGIKPDGVQENWWSEWDESVLQSLISALKRLQKYYGNKK